MILNVFKVLIHVYLFFECVINFLIYAYYFSIRDHCFAILKMLLSFLNLVQYIFTCVLKCCFHACYFLIRDCGTLGGNLTP